MSDIKGAAVKAVDAVENLDNGDKLSALAGAAMAITGSGAAAQPLWLTVVRS